MTTGSPMRLIFRFAVPLLLGNLLQQAYSLIDAAIVGQCIGMNALGAVGASSSVIFLIFGFCNGCTAGFGIPVAQKFGAKDYHAMRQRVANSYRLSLHLSLVLALATSLMCHSIMEWMQTPDELLHDAWLYLLILFIGIPFTMFYNLLASILRAVGDSKTPFFFLVVASALNVVLDLFFILVLHWGVAGAAVATVVAQGLSALACWLFMRRHFPILQLKDNEGRYDKRSILELLNMGVPMGLQFSITAIGSIMLQSANNALGTACATAFTAGMRLKMFFICPLENLGVALATFCGQNLGAKEYRRIWTGIRDGMVMVAIYTVATLLVLQGFARNLSQLFIHATEKDILDMSAQFLHISSPFYFVLGLLCVLRYSLQGIGHTKVSMMSGVFEMVTRTAVSLAVVPALGFTGVCIGDPAAWIAADVFLIPAFWIAYRRLTRTPQT